MPPSREPAWAPVLEPLLRQTAQQDWPAPALYVLATPIGNLGDLSLRALHLLQLADTLACEDTRHTQQLLRACGIDVRGEQLLALHQHNEQSAAQTVIERLAHKQRVVCVSDAGTPAVSDPGARLVAAVRAQGFRVIPIPGASSVTSALSVAGVVAPTDQSGFVFVGFLPSKGRERSQAIAALGEEPRTVVLLESPHRMAELAQSLAALGERPLTVARELTKQYEQVHTLPAQALSAWLAEKPERLRGEFVLVVHAHTGTIEAGSDSPGQCLLARLLSHLPLKTAVQVAAEFSGESKNALYSHALHTRANEDRDDATP